MAPDTKRKKVPMGTRPPMSIFFTFFLVSELMVTGRPCEIYCILIGFLCEGNFHCYVILEQ